MKAKVQGAGRIQNHKSLKNDQRQERKEFRVTSQGRVVHFYVEHDAVEPREKEKRTSMCVVLACEHTRYLTFTNTS